MLALTATPVHGQMAIYVDEHGKRVYVNEDPVQRLTRTTKCPPGASASCGMSQRVPDERLERLVQETALRHHVDPALVRAVIQAESGWNPSAVSRKGALGLMQLVPGTAQRLGVADALNPQQNVDAGVRYLRALLVRYNGDLNRALAAYNAGEHAVDRAGGVPNYPETRNYVQKITDTYFRPGSGRLRDWWNAPRPIYQARDDKGRVVFTNE